MNSDNYIRYWRDKADLTQQELADKAGIARTTIFRLESGLQKGSIESISKIATALGITIDQLRYGPDVERKLNKDITDYQPGEHIPGLGTMIGPVDMSDTIPLLGSIPAGDWKIWCDQHPPGFGEDTVPRLDVRGKCAFAVKVSGESMMGVGIHDGDLLYCNPEIPFIPRRSGSVGVVRWDGSYKIRRVVLAPDGMNYTLTPANPAFREELVPIEGTTIFKVVRWVPNAEGLF